MRLIFCLILIIFLPGCAKKQLVQPVELETVKQQPKNIPELSQYIEEPKPIKKFRNTGELLEHALQNSRQRPKQDKFLNAITLYDYMPGSIYQVYTAPLKVTMLSLEKGEKLVAPPQGGDTARWQLNVISSGNGKSMQQHLIIKPLRDGLKNNLILTTNKQRTYLIELISFKNSYMAAINWNYPNQNINIKPKSLEKMPLNFKYKIKNKSGRPVWKPSKVYDDGYKTFIHFKANVKQDELPALYIVTKETRTQLVNYRVQDNTMIVDRLFKTAELRLGLKKPEIVRIIRKS